MISQYEGYHLGAALFSSPKLTAASVRGCVSRDDVLRSLGSNLGYSKSLTCLDVSCGFAPIGVSGSALLAVGLKRNRSLTDINLSCNDLGTEGLLNIVTALSGHNRMKRLSVAYNNIPPEGGTWLAQVSYTPPSYGRTEFCNAAIYMNIYTHMYVTLAQFLDLTHSMEVLDVSHNFLSLPALTTFMCAGKPPRGREKPGCFDDPLLFENISMLVQVDASHNPIYEIEPRLGWAVGRACRLVRLNLSHCQIADGIHEFAVGFDGQAGGFLASTTLQFLNLAHNEFKDSAVLPRMRYLLRSSWLHRLHLHPSLVQIDLRGNMMGNDAALSLVAAIHALQNRATKRGRAATGFYPSCELICEDNLMSIELQRAIFYGGSNEIRDSRYWLQEYHRQCKEAIWIARKKALQEFVDKGVYETKALLLYIWQSKPSLWMRFHTVKFFTGEPPVWWVVAQEAQTRKTMQLEKLVRMMEDQEDAALAARGLTRGPTGQVQRRGADSDDLQGGGID